MAAVDIADEDAGKGTDTGFTDSPSTWAAGLSMAAPARYVCRHMMPSDIQQVRELHDQLFPVKYGAGFYSKLVNNPNGNITSLVLVDTEMCAKMAAASSGTEKKEGGEKANCCEGSAPEQAIIGVATCRVTDVEDSILGYLLGYKEACKVSQDNNNINLRPFIRRPDDHWDLERVQTAWACRAAAGTAERGHHSKLPHGKDNGTPRPGQQRGSLFVLQASGVQGAELREGLLHV